MGKKILANNYSDVLIENNWVEKLYKWADENDISSDIIPREQNKLLQLKEINLNNKYLEDVPDELTYLTSLTFLELSNNNLTQLPTEIGSLERLNFLSISMNNITELPESIIKLKKLKNFWFPRNQLNFKESQLEWIEDLKLNGCYVYS